MEPAIKAITTNKTDSHFKLDIRPFSVGLLTALLLLIRVGAVSAEPKPLWETGVGLAGLSTPHYLGAEQNSHYLLPLPYFVYRGPLVKADREGLRGNLYDSEKLDLKLSVGGSLPVNSEDNDARQGMEDLDLMLEMGPTLQYQLINNDRYLLRADWPVRGVFTVGDQFLRHQGWVTNPRLHFETDLKQWRLSANLGVVYSDRRYHGYIYDVDTDDVRSDRPFYQSDSGYTGNRFSVGVKRRRGPYIYGINLRYYSLEEAANADSPLMKKDEYASVSFFVGWMIKQSRTLVGY